MLLELIIIILLSVIGILNVVLCEKLNRIEITMSYFRKRFGFLFRPNDKDVESNN